jgi:hypothetical protein
MSLVRTTPSGAGPALPQVDRLQPELATDSYRLARAFLLLMTVTVVDVFNVLDRGFAAFRPEAQAGGPIRYLVLLVPITVVAWARFQAPSFLLRRPSASELVLLVLFALGLGGALVGLVILGTEETARPVFLPMSLGLLALFVVREPTEREIGRIHRWLSNVGLLYIVMNTLVNLNVLPFSEYQQYRNASVAFLALGLGAAAAAGQRRRLLVELVLTVVVFVTYPSATMVLVLLTVGLTLYLTTGRATPLRSVVVAGVVVTFAVFAIANLQAGVDVADQYFDLVNKANANATRLDLWTAGVDRFEESPLVGSVFSGDVVAERSRDGKALPYHNDFVLFLALGGLLGIGLLVGWIVVTEATLIQRIHRFRRAGDPRRADLLRAILVGLNAFIVAMGFNPVLSGASRSAVVFGLYAIAMSIGVPRKESIEPAATISGTAAVPYA